MKKDTKYVIILDENFIDNVNVFIIVETFYIPILYISMIKNWFGSLGKTHLCLQHTVAVDIAITCI